MSGGKSRCQVVGCTRPVHGAYVCEPCLGGLEEALGDLPVLAHALEDAYVLSQRFSVAGVGLSDPEESGLPFGERAGKQRRLLDRLLLNWFLTVDRTLPAPVMAVPSTVQAMSAHLLRYLGWFRTNPAGPAAVTQFRDLRKRALAVVDRPPDLIYLGICSWETSTGECPQDLYAEWGNPVTRCRGCGNEHDVRNRQSVLLNAVRDQLATAADISRGLAGLDMKITAERIRQWKARHRIEERSTNYHGHPLYRVGDVIDLYLERSLERKERRA